VLAIAVFTQVVGFRTARLRTAELRRFIRWRSSMPRHLSAGDSRPASAQGNPLATWGALLCSEWLFGRRWRCANDFRNRGNSPGAHPAACDFGTQFLLGLGAYWSRLTTWMLRSRCLFMVTLTVIHTVGGDTLRIFGVGSADVLQVDSRGRKLPRRRHAVTIG